MANSESTSEIKVEDDNSTCSTVAKVGVATMGVITLLGIIAAVVVVAFVTEMVKAPKSELVFVQVIFNSGAHAPDVLTDEASFPRGAGQLTDRGFADSYRLGEFLHDRYVKTDFIDPLLKTNQMSWLSSKNDKCLSTASTVSAGMMNSETKLRYAPVLAADGILSEDSSRCTNTKNLIYRNCSTSPQDDLLQCLNIQNVLFNKYNLSQILEFVEKSRNKLDVPREVQDRIDQVIDIYSKIHNYKLGVGEHRNEMILRVKFGAILHRIVNQFNKPIKAKFFAYSVDDDLFSGLIEILKPETTVVPKIVGFNSMILIELRKFDNDETKLDIKYKSDEENWNDFVQFSPKNFKIADLVEKTSNLVDENKSSCEH